MAEITLEQINATIRKNSELTAKVLESLVQTESDVPKRKTRDPYEQRVLDGFELK